MKGKCTAAGISAAGIAWVIAAAGVLTAFGSDVPVEVIRVDGLVPDLPITLRESWNAIGADPGGNVYFAFCGPTKTASDCALFQYHAKKGKPRLIGTVSQALAAAGNLQKDEPIPKGHTQLPYLNGKIYMGTMGFHDAVKLDSEQMDAAMKTRGAHLLAYDTSTGRLEDLSAGRPGGVFFKGQGFMALAPVPGRNLLAAFTVPNGDVLLYDPGKPASSAVVKGVPEELGHYVGRVVIPVSERKIYFSYHSAHPPGSPRPPGRMYYADPSTGRRSAKPFDCDPHVLNGQLVARDGRSIYVSSDRAYLYRLLPEQDRLELLGSLCPESARRTYKDASFEYSEPRLAGIVFSSDETRIYSVPTQRRRPLNVPAGDPRARFGGMVVYGLCEFDLKTRKATVLTKYSSDAIPAGVWVQGSGARDPFGNMYFLAFDMKGFCALLKFHVG